jgi:replicative DNA helicase
MKEVEQNNTKVVMIDNIQAIKADKYFRNRDESVGYVCHELKKLARELQILIIVLSNLNRSSEYRNSLDKHPQLADLRESGSLEQCADKVLFIHRPEYYKIYEDECGNDLTDIVEIIVAKNRNGRIGDVQLQKTRNFTNIKDKDTLPSTGIPFPEDRLKEIEDCPY